MKKFYLLLLGNLFFFCGSLGQTYTVPIQGPGFDDGNSFTTNGWSVVNSSANQWVVGSETYHSSPNSAYISYDGDPSHYSYDNTTPHISHFYQKISIPANAFNITISFWLKGNNQVDAGLNMHDGLQVYIDPTLTPPLADALPGVTASMVFFQFDQNSGYTKQTATLDGLGLENKSALLIFTWVNDGDGVGDGPPASIDNAQITYCLKSSDFNVTGGGAYCTGSSGVGVGLSGSTIGINYQLYCNGSPVGAPVMGTGAALDFGPQKTVGTYKISGSTTCNAGSFTFPMIGSVTVAENSLPIPTAGSNAPLCVGSTLNLTSSGGTTYSWTGPNGFTSTDQNPIIPNFTASEAGTYTVAVTDNNGCSTPATIDVKVTAGNATGGALSSASICSGGGGTLTLSGNSNSPDHWEYTTDSTNSSSWIPIPNTTNTLNFSGNTIPTFYRAVISDGCSNAYSDTATVSIHNFWTGTTNSDWNTGGNWSDGSVPDNSCPTIVPVVALSNYPILSTGAPATISSLQIATGASVTVTGNTIQIAGTITNGGIFDVTDGTVELNGTSTQNIEGKDFANAIAGQNNTVKNLVISNNVNVAATANDTLNITGTLSFGTSSAQLQTGNNITLKSSATATANVGVLASGNAITGDVTVERYTGVGAGHGASWQFVATPTQGQTVLQSWMENGLVPVGYGTQVTDPSGTANGFDAVTQGVSLKSYNPATDGWVGIGNPTTTQVYNQEGYMLFVRGDRSVSYPSVGNTTLRTKGTLFTPSNPPPSTTVTSGKFASVGNPYASAISMNSINLIGDVGRIFTVWDPVLGGAYGVGGYRTLAQTGPSGDLKFYATPLAASGIYSGPVTNIESGQAFFVQSSGTSGGGTVSFDEGMKTSSGSNMVFRGGSASGVSGNLVQLRANLYGIRDTAFLADGNLIQYNPSYSNKYDKMDARKIFNSAENFGIFSSGKYLVIERRTGIQKADTIFYNLTGLRAQKYKIMFTANGLSAYGLQGFVEDTYLKTRTPLNMEGGTEVDFTVTNAAGSYAANRFRIVFAPLPPTEVALTFISLEAHQQDADIAVSWKVKNEKGMKQYEVEKSMDGVNFTRATTVTATNNGIGSYQWTDNQVTPGDNYYRIRCVGMDGRISYSTVVKVTVMYENPSISIHPNPITDGIIHLQFVNQPQGRYGIRLMNSLGQVIVSKQVEHAAGNATENIQWNYYLAHGVYQLEITKPDGSVKIIKVLY